MTGYQFLAIAVAIAVLAMAAILGRIFVEYGRGSLTPRSLLVGGFLFAGILGLFVAGVQMLVRGG